MNERWKRGRLIIAGVVAALLIPVPWLMAARRHPTSAVVQSRTVIAPPAPPLVQDPAPRFEAPPVIQEPSPFEPVPHSQATPRIVVFDRRERDLGDSALILYGTQTHTLLIRPGENALDVPAGEYEYELRSIAYRMRGVPDQAGTLRCRQFTRYELDLVLSDRGPQFGQDLGDGATH